jgi:hypothetical protein
MRTSGMHRICRERVSMIQEAIARGSEDKNIQDTLQDGMSAFARHEGSIPLSETSDDLAGSLP